MTAVNCVGQISRFELEEISLCSIVDNVFGLKPTQHQNIVGHQFMILYFNGRQIFEFIFYFNLKYKIEQCLEQLPNRSVVLNQFFTKLW